MWVLWAFCSAGSIYNWYHWEQQPGQEQAAAVSLFVAIFFAALLASSLARSRQRARQTEILDRLVKLEEQRSAAPTSTITSTVPAGYKRVTIAGHLVDVPVESRTADRPTRLTNPHEHGLNN